MYKKDIINFLFVISFPWYGSFNHFGRAFSPSVAILFSILPFLAIVVFYLIDVLYKRDLQSKMKGGIYWWMMAYIFSIIGALFVANYKGTPLMSLSVAIATSLSYLAIFNAFTIVFLYNDNKSDQVVLRLTLISIGLLLFINVVGFYGLGISSKEVSFEEGGRDTMPFFKGVWDAGAVISTMCLFVIWLIPRMSGNSLKVLGLGLLLLFLFFILVRSNSRISILLLILTLGIFALKGAKSHLVYWISLFTVPLVLNSRYLLFTILSHPILKPIMLRTDFEDIITLNGRTILWQRGIEWLLYDQRGLFLGLGNQGQYFIGLLRDIQLLWHPTDPHIMHFHSATFEVLVDQGLVGLLLLLVILYKLFVYYRQEFENKRPKGMFFLAVIFLLFNAQIDVFILFGATGTLIFFLLVAGATMKTNQTEERKVSELSEAEAIPE